MKTILHIAICGLSILMLRAEPKTEIDVILARIDQAPFDSEFSKRFKNAVKDPEPRLYELMRRIEVPPYSKNLGVLNTTIGNTNKDFLYPQIDGVLLKGSIDGSDGIISTRVILFWKRSAIRIVFWNRTEGEQGLSKTVWSRKFPPSIDLTMPTDDWFDGVTSRLGTMEECEQLVPLFDDPMPPSTLNVTAHQMAGDRNYIIEMVTSTNGKLKYHWAIRSPQYAGLIEATSFEKIWDVISELPK